MTAMPEPAGPRRPHRLRLRPLDAIAPEPRGRRVLSAPQSLRLTRRSRCAGVAVRAGSGQADVSSYRARLHADSGPLIEVVDADARVVLTDSRVSAGSGVLLSARGGSGSRVRLVARDQKLTGDVVAEPGAAVSVSLEDGSSLTGAIDRAHAAQEVSVRLDASSTWLLTGRSHVTRITGLDVWDGVVHNIHGHGRHVYYDRAGNPTLGGATLELAGGGTLRPE